MKQVIIRTKTWNPEHLNLKLIDWHNSSDRKWLMNHMHWAMHNKAEIEIKEANGYDLETYRQASLGLLGASRSAESN